MSATYFVTGIGTNVGKTIVSAVLTEALMEDYWKPVQAGDLENLDTMKFRKLVSNNNMVFHTEGISLTKQMSPHATSAIDRVTISAKKILRPQTTNDLIIEGAC